MKRLICFLAPLIFLVVVGCGGGDSVPPPPAPLTLDKPDDKQMLKDLQDAAMRAKESCSQQYAPIFTLMAAQMTQSKAQGGQQAPLPVMPQQSGGQCNNDISQLLLLYSTIRVPQPGGADTMYAYLPESKEWLIKSVGKALVNSVGKSLQDKGIPMTPDIVQSLFAVAIQHVNQNIKPNLPGQAQAVASSAGSQYGM